MAGKARTSINRSSSLFAVLERELKAEQLDAIKCIYDGKDVFLRLPTGFGKSICYETLPFVFNYKHSDGGTGGGCSVVLVVSPLASTLQAVYLVWLFLRITTTCNLSIIGLVRGRFPELSTHAQTVDTRSLFPPPTWPGYKAIIHLNISLRYIIHVCASIITYPLALW